MSQRHSLPVFYAVTTAKGPSPSTPTHFCIGPMAFVEAYFPRAELTEKMGGWAMFVRTSTGEKWLGVWGARKASRFRRMLRERGAMFELEREIPAGIRPSRSVTR